MTREQRRRRMRRWERYAVIIMGLVVVILYVALLVQALNKH